MTLLKDQPISFQLVRPGSIHSYQALTIILDKKIKQHRDEILKRLEKNGVQARKYYYPSLNSVSCFKNKRLIDAYNCNVKTIDYLMQIKKYPKVIITIDVDSLKS
jgi:dTDP-4-amino-4,6-dideoxygalactose transaminase